MKKANLIIIATIIGTLVISIFAFQPTTEASNNAMLSATPKSKKKRIVSKPKKVKCLSECQQQLDWVKSQKATQKISKRKN